MLFFYLAVGESAGPFFWAFANPSGKLTPGMCGQKSCECLPLSTCSAFVRNNGKSISDPMDPHTFSDLDPPNLHGHMAVSPITVPEKVLGSLGKQIYGTTP